ncbi:hypothetical protein RJ640_022601 [Escallonia rubra]|uniref:CUE domain-containing protein n=1 Tax=Escallonia rubra TaxID=112253 RepID=A0AA88UFM7_9ASTE|nr:hypothetical protein RJ640_022601 [Escallonia rubra]
MKAGTSSLNPYAASYIPLSRRGVADENKGYESTAKASKGGSEAVWLGSHPGDTTQNQYHKASYYHNAQESKLKGRTGYGFYGSSSQKPNDMTEKQILDEEYDMDLAYLQVTFPGVSEESLTDVYAANKGDLEATVDMLNQLELYTGDSFENLPDTLDIGDVPEGGSSSGSLTPKMKKVAGAVGGSSSGSRIQPSLPD